MRFIWIALCLFSFAVRSSNQKSTPTDHDYVAAVVEFQLTKNSSIALTEYVDYIKTAAEKDADIVVFPEMTLIRKSEHVNVPIHGLLTKYQVPALHPELYDEPLVSISQAARDHEIYVVINIQEQMDCLDAPEEYCPEKKIYRFNTNVVFDRTGAVIDRYRKINPFGEATRSAALKPDLGVFDTDFGVQFGHFICFDIMFQVPAVQTISKLNIKNIVYPTMWFSEMPYLTAVETQQSYAYAMDVNLLAANANNIKFGTGGSGIFSGKYGPLVSIMSGVPGTRMLVAKVPKTPGEVDKTHEYPGPMFDNPSDTDEFTFIKDHTLPSSTSHLLTKGYQVFTLEDNDVLCKITATLNRLNTENTHTYRAFVYRGTNTYLTRRLGVIVCTVVACENDDVESCPYRFSKSDANLQFEQLKIEMTSIPASYNEALQCQNIEYFPISLRINKFPIDSTNFTFIEETTSSGHELITYELKAPQNDLISLGVWGRDYNKDNAPQIDFTEEDINNSIEMENMLFHEAEATEIEE